MHSAYEQYFNKSICSFYVSYAWQDTDTNRKNRHKYKARVSTGLRISISIGRMVEERCINYRIIKKTTHNFFSSFSKYDMFVIEYVEVLLTLIPKWCTKNSYTIASYITYIISCSHNSHKQWFWGYKNRLLKIDLDFPKIIIDCCGC